MDKKQKVNLKKIQSLKRRINEYYELSKNLDAQETPNRGIDYLSKQIYYYVIESKENRINELEEALQTIVDIAQDYDGYDKAENLKGLIDDLVEVSRKGLNGEPIFKKIQAMENRHTQTQEITQKKSEKPDI